MALNSILNNPDISAPAWSDFKVLGMTTENIHNHHTFYWSGLDDGFDPPLPLAPEGPTGPTGANGINGLVGPTGPTGSAPSGVTNISQGAGITLSTNPITSTGSISTRAVGVGLTLLGNTGPYADNGIINYWAVDWEGDVSSWDPSTGIYTVPNTGMYLVSYILLQNAQSFTSYIQQTPTSGPSLYSAVLPSMSLDHGQHISNGSCTLACLVNDQITIRSYCGGDNTIDLNIVGASFGPTTIFSINYIGTFT